MKLQNNKNAIKKCRACESKKLINILSLGKSYLSDFVANNNKPLDYPLSLVLCEKCSLLQLKHTVPQKLLYTERYGYRSGINNTVRRDLEDIVRKATKKIEKVNTQLSIVDIGANDGTLLSNYPSYIFRIGIEPIIKFAEECKKHANVVVNDFFSLKSYRRKLKNKKVHIVTAISCFYDIDKPNEFLSDIAKILDKDGILIIQQNYLVGMLEQNAFDNIVHEHLEYYSLLSLENLLKKHNLEVFDVERSGINGGSFRTYIAQTGCKKISKSVEKLRKYEKRMNLHEQKIYKDFAIRVRRVRDKLRALINNLKRENKTVYVYGASTRGNTLLQYSKLNKNLIKAAVEKNPEKWGKKIASVGIPIISEEQARKERPDYMLVLPWFFKEEFLKREKKYLDSGGHFIFPLPKVEVT